MATLSTQSIDQDGHAPTYAAAAVGGDKVVPGAGSFIHVKNGDSTPTDVILVTPGTVSSLPVGDQTVTVPNGAERMIAVADIYRNPSDGLASITYSKVASLTIGSFRAPVSG